MANINPLKPYQNPYYIERQIIKEKSSSIKGSKEAPLPKKSVK